jgi:hypothetical protein
MSTLESGFNGHRRNIFSASSDDEFFVTSSDLEPAQEVTRDLI